MEFGVVFTSHPNPEEEPYPPHDVHARTSDEVLGREKTRHSLRLFAERVIPAFRPPAERRAAAE